MQFLRQINNKKFQIGDFVLLCSMNLTIKVNGKVVEYDYAYTRGVENLFYAVGKRTFSLRGMLQNWRNINNNTRTDYNSLVSVFEGQVNRQSLLFSIPDLPSYNVVMTSFEISQQGGDPGYKFSIEMTEDTPVIATQIISNSQNSIEQEFDAQEEDSEINYTIVSGDTLWAIASRYLGNGMLWRRLYNYRDKEGVLNKDRLNTDNPNLIFPNTTMKIPSFIS